MNQTMQRHGEHRRKSLFVLRSTDFTGRDDIASREPCKGGLEEAVRLISVKSGAGRYDTCFALRGGSELVTIQAVGHSEMGNGAKWSTSKGADLIVCGKDTGHRSKGKMLIALMDVDCCFGDGKNFGGVSSYESALARVKREDNPLGVTPISGIRRPIDSSKSPRIEAPTGSDTPVWLALPVGRQEARVRL